MMITLVDILYFGVAFTIFTLLFGFIEAAAKDLIKWFRKKPNKRLETRQEKLERIFGVPESTPLMTKDLDDLKSTLRSEGFNPNCRCTAIPTPEQERIDQELVDALEKRLKASAFEDELIMELGEDTLKDYWNGRK